MRSSAGHNRFNAKTVKRKSIATNCTICLIITALLVVSAVSVVTILYSDRENNMSNKFTVFVSEMADKGKKTISKLRHFEEDEGPSELAVPADINSPDTTVNTANPTPFSSQKSVRKPLATGLHFIHIPKCGGTTMTAVLRQIQCAVDPIKNSDCCLNPGFCDWHAFRRCASIQGCINHFPNRKFIYKPMPSVAVFREPTARILSAWFYRGHSPNLDFFQVRPEFKEISKGLRPRVTFEEYVEMPEYHNVQTRMLGADSFPYRNITITEEVYEKAVDAMNHLFFVGLQEAFGESAQALVRELGVRNVSIDIRTERDNANAQTMRQKAEIRGNPQVMQRLREVNSYDLRLFKLVTGKFCAMIRKYPDLMESVVAKGKISCEDSS